MAADSPPQPGHSAPNKLSFASVLTAPSPSQDQSGPSPQRGSHKGEPAGFFPPDLIDNLSQPYRYALVGKFSKGRPSMEKIHEFFKAQDFVDTFSVGLLDPRHIIVNFQGERDFHRFYSRMLWYVGDFPMRMFKWTSDFHVERESSIVPIWFKFPKLPIHFFHPKALFFLASLFGSPLRMDSATQSLKRPSVARIQVEIDLLKRLPSRVWIGTGENQGFWQKVEADEDLPHYCSHCWHVGHSEAVCTIKHPELKSRPHAPPKDSSTVPPVGMIYRPITVPDSRPSASGLTDSDKLLIPTAAASIPDLAPLSDVAPLSPPLTVPPLLEPIAEALENPPPSGQVFSSPNSEHAGDTDEEIEAESPGRPITLTVPSVPLVSHSDTDDPVHVSTLADFRTFATTLPHLVPQQPSDDPWLQPKRRKKYTKRSFGPPNVRTRSSTSLFPIIND